ncbi:hypothetical protein PV08_07881 [Exophiala spinifera]|uniref:Bifunctional cytochrome P450/NADPH--P450 reductase n=1 Tax=Exophiala spinifera TaxID=91928 RepID=A0A0D2BV36_9EURO|nr:uncharacterized protein PV08_07881 [Exophiala spinifera]KIW15094.1 hypothetical protein PV08_07881 [Exophiala spinifera]
MAYPVPQPPTIPFLGNVWDLDPKNSMQSLLHLGEKYGPIFKLSLVGRERYFINSAALLDELCDERRFCKAVTGALQEVRHGVKDGLFTAYPGEHNWDVAHRTLVPAFGPIGIHDMYDEMYDIATQLVAKWARVGPDEKINVTDDYTRLTLDSIALCAMGKRFNSFYSENMHPFVNAMVGFLLESGRRAGRTRLESLFSRAAARQFEEDIATMKSVAEEVIAHRRANPTDKKDLLNAMLYGKDPKTGERLTHESVMNNMITFLIAGHETTSGLLSFATYYLVKNPEVMRKAQAEVDAVVGKGPVSVQHMSKLPYIEAILRETLRLQPTAPAFAVRALDTVAGPTVLGGKYHIPHEAVLVALLPGIGRDAEVFGPDCNDFVPERMSQENFAKLPKNAWKPFGNGARGCIGRPFAWQEAILTLALVLQNFNLRADDPSYQLQIKQTLTIKPDNFSIRAVLRDGIDPLKLEKKMHVATETDQVVQRHPAAVKSAESGKPMLVLYGSNSGTCEGLAQSLAGSAGNRGYFATVKPLDAAVDQLPTKQPIVIITASYEGNPPDNAGAFVEWLQNVSSEKLKDVKFAVFGCGHHDWVTTFQKVPKLIDSELSSRGAEQIASRGESDVALGTIFDDFDSWQDESLWPALSADASAAEVAEGLSMEISTTTRASHLRHKVMDALVVENTRLTPVDTPEKRWATFKLPTSLTYEAGDYLAVLPINAAATISRVLRRFGLPWDAMMTLQKGAHTTIPTGVAMPVTAVLGAYVELSSVATRKNIATLVRYAGADEKPLAEELSATTGQLSVLEILEKHPSLNVSFPVFLSMLTPMRIRQYSIASSPLSNPTEASIMYSVVRTETGRIGVATNYLKDLQPGSTAQIMIKKSHASFHLPRDPKTPIIMVCAGTGLAPFMGFVQERAARFAATSDGGVDGDTSEPFGQAVLIIGCRHPDVDRLHAKQLADWQDQGVVRVFYAFSRDPDRSDGCKYAQDRLWRERELVSDLFDQGARAYICGSSALGKGVGQVAAKMAVEGAKKKGKEVSIDKGLEWWEGLRGERYAVDVFD